MIDMPTSPASRTDIEAAFGDATAEPPAFAPAASIAQEWRRLGLFLRRPTLPSTLQGDTRAPLTILARLYALDMAIMLALIGVASAAVALGFELPETALAGVELTPVVALLVIFGAPAMEELAFRGWLSGRPGPLLAAGFIATGLAVAFGTDLADSQAPINWRAIGLAVMIVTGALASLIVLRGRPPGTWFARWFSVFFWGSTIAFALVHVANFGEAPLVAVLPLVIPQFVLGALLGYLRVTIGLWAAIALHAAHNATALGIAALAIGGG